MRVAGLLAALGLLTALGGCAQPGPRTDGIPVLFAPAKVETTPEVCALTRLATLDLTVDGMILVHVAINGVPATLILDTGAERSILTQAAARRTRTTDKYDFSRPVRGIAAVVAAGDARLQSFVAGGYALPDPRLLVGNVVLPSSGGVEADGLLGADLLSDFDLDLDVPHRRLTLYARTQCPSLQPPWSGRYVTLKTTRSLHRHPFFTVALDGHAFEATIDSAAQRSVLGALPAQRAGLTAARLANDPVVPMRGAAAEILSSHAHRFGTMSIGGETIRAPVVMIAPVALAEDEADMILGLDHLRSHRIWLSYGSRLVFQTTAP